MKFSLWIEIHENSLPDNDEFWTIRYTVHDCNIYKEEFFIDSYPISFKEESLDKYQTIKFNEKLHKIIQKLLLPKSKTNFYVVNKQTAWDYYHYVLHTGGFVFNVHPVSMSGKFLRQEFIGTQEEIYEKCLELNTKWISKNKLL